MKSLYSMGSSVNPDLLPKLLLPFVLFYLCHFPSSVSSTDFPVNVWPRPRLFSWAQPFEATFIAPNFSISAADHPYLTPAVGRYHRLIQAERYEPIVVPSTTVNRTVSTSLLVALKIDVADVAAPLEHGVNESYTLIIPSDSPAAHLSAATVWAAMRGLETFSQLLWGYPPRAAAGVTISDSPIYAHRGLLLDTSRNYYPVEDILRTIGAMSMNKMNVFHWHITDSQSFPLILPSEPDLGHKGSYGPDMRYSHQDVMRIVESGFQHGVRVLPEIDSPGHTGSWANAYPEIVTCAGMFWWPVGAKWSDRLASEPGTGQLNPLNPKTYEVVRNVIRDVAEMFPEQLFHGGADEVAPSCWKTDPAVRSFLSSGGTLDSLLEKFVNATLPYITSLGRRVIYWEDVLFGADVRVRSSVLPVDDVVLQTWNGSPNSTKRIVQSGYPVIVSSSEFYYLDCGHGSFLGNSSRYDRPPGTDQGDGGSWCGPFKTWQMIYNYDIAHGLSEEERRLVLGGEVALWSEQADAAVLDARVWPRAAAMAEALWSGNRDENGRKRTAEATDRLNQWRHRMYANRGISAEPIQPLWCLRNHGMCNAASHL